MKLSRSLFRLALLGALISGVNAYGQTPASGAKSTSDDSPASSILSSKVIADRSAQSLGDTKSLGDAATQEGTKTLGDAAVPLSVAENLPKPTLASVPLQWKAPVVPEGAKSLGDTKSLADTESEALGASAEGMIGQGIPLHSTGYLIGSDEPAADPAAQVPAKSLSGNCDSPVGSCSTKSLCASSCNETYYWLDAEALLWFGDNLNSPPLVTTAAAGVGPIAGAAGVTNAFGGPDGIDPGLLPGYRMSFGTWLNDERTLGVGARVYGLFSGGNSFADSGAGNNSVGRPYVDFNSGLEAVYDVNFELNGVPHWDGSVNAANDLSMIGVDVLGKVLITGDNSHRLNLLAGYQFNRLDNDLSIRSFRTNLLTGDGIPDGTTFDTSDNFSTSNTFHGGALGMESDFRRGRFTVGSLAKVGFGNFSQDVNIRGATTTVDGQTQVVTNTTNGVLAQGSNAGTYSRDRFGFMPEIGMKLGYDVRNNVRFTVGYTFLYWSDVAPAGDQVNPMVDLLQNSNNPTFTFRETGYWMQGLDLGLSFSY